MFAKCVRILYGNITVLLAVVVPVVVVAFCARFRSSSALAWVVGNEGWATGPGEGEIVRSKNNCKDMCDGC